MIFLFLLLLWVVGLVSSSSGLTQDLFASTVRSQLGQEYPRWRLASPLLIPVFGEGDREAGLRGTLRWVGGAYLSYRRRASLYKRRASPSPGFSMWSLQQGSWTSSMVPGGSYKCQRGSRQAFLSLRARRDICHFYCGLC